MDGEISLSSAKQSALAALEFRIKTILPAQYQDSYDEVQPVSMGSAGLKYGDDGKVAWDEIWSTFCDLAMAGGPPHKGKLLEPASRSQIDAHPDRYQQVVQEICRGVAMAAELEAQPSPMPGWIRVDCLTETMAEWLVRAIVMENVSARCEGRLLDLPAGPDYRLEKEIKNVVTVIAKTSHYWVEHMYLAQQRAIANLFLKLAMESPLVQPALSEQHFESGALRRLRDQMSQDLYRATGMRVSKHEYLGWLGLECPDIHSAIWMMRALVASNVLSRREDTVLFVPVNPADDPHGETLVRSVVDIHSFAVARNIL